MSDAFVLDSSAILAVLQAEPGQDQVLRVLPDALICAVNLAEIVSTLADRGMAAERAHRAAIRLGFSVAPLDEELARIASELRPTTRAAGLSLGVRCCLALGRQRRAIVLTADCAWSTVADAVGVRIRNIRPVA